MQYPNQHLLNESSLTENTNDAAEFYVSVPLWACQIATAART